MQKGGGIMASVPKDPVMLLSYINTQLRDNYPDMEELCSALLLSKEEVDKTLSSIGYVYDQEKNKYV